MKRLELDHVGSEVGQETGGEGSGNEGTQVEHPKAVQRAHLLAKPDCRRLRRRSAHRDPDVCERRQERIRQLDDSRQRAHLPRR